MIARRLVSSLAAACGLALLASGAPLACTPEAPPRIASPPPAPPASAPSTTEVAPPAAPAESASPSAEPPRTPRFAVTTENATATEVAMKVLERGGNAADAAIAAVLTMGVVQPVSSGLGGGGFALVWSAKDRKVTALDFREVAPRGIKSVDYLAPGKERGATKRGVMTGVPGEAAGLAELHHRFGKLALAEDIGAAEKIAQEGFAVSAHLARALRWNQKWIEGAPRYELFRPAGKLVERGASVKNPALAATLRRFASEGARAFYEGVIGADIVATARAGGSRMIEDDLRRYRVLERTPARIAWEGHEIVTMPPPSAGGLLLLETLAMHAKADLETLGFGTGAYDHLLAETFRGALADRVRLVGDPDFMRSDVEGLADRARMKARRAKISLDATMPAERFPVTEAGTSHLVVVDAEGDVVSITSTVNDMFGAKLVTEGGFALNDELADFTDPKVLRLFGMMRGPNAPHGGARPVSSMTPVLVLDQGKPVLALGGSGGGKIATGVTQVLLATLAFGRSLELAVADPRVDTPTSGGLTIDPGAPPDLLADLRRRGEIVESSKPSYSAVQVVRIGEAGGVRTLEAAADPRKGGSSLVE